jgi:hypothetical protein
VPEPGPDLRRLGLLRLSAKDIGEVLTMDLGMPEGHEVKEPVHQDALNVLLKEYDTLRSEILARIGNRFALLSVVVAAVAFVGSQKVAIGGWRWGLLALATVVISLIWVQLGRAIGRLSTRIAVIEGKVNEITGDELLHWESDRQGGLFNRVF